MLTDEFDTWRCEHRRVTVSNEHHVESCLMHFDKDTYQKSIINYTHQIIVFFKSMPQLSPIEVRNHALNINMNA